MFSVSLCLFLFQPPKGGRGCLMSPPVWNLRAVIWFHFTISSLEFLPSPVTLSVYLFLPAGPFFWTFFQKSVQYFSLRDRLFLYGFCLAVRISAACCHMALVFAVIHLHKKIFYPPGGRPGMSDVSPLSGISGLSFDSTLLSPLLFFCLVLLPFLSYLFLPAGPSYKLFPKNSSIFFVKR